MQHKFLPAVFLLLSFFTFNTHSKAQTDVNDSLALVALYKSTNGPSWKHHKNWLKGPVSTWYGITTSGNRVVSVSLGINNLSGTLPKTLGNLTALQNLVLFYNALTGEIPSALGKITTLYELELNNNLLSGSVPASLGNLNSVAYFTLNNNSLTGSIPNALTKLQSVINFNLSYNQLTGVIPDEIGNLPCRYLVLNNNNLSGHIPNSINKFSGIALLNLSYNNLSGQIPDISLLEFNNTNIDVYLNNNHLINRLEPARAATGNTYISNNNFTFTGLEKLLNYGGFLYPIVEYSNQAQLTLHTNGNKLSVSAGGTVSNNTYRWYKDGVLDATIVGDSTYSPATSGSYHVNITNSIAANLILYTDTVSFTASFLSHNIKLAVSPNPVSSVLTLSGLNPQSDYSVTIVGANGNARMQIIAKHQLTLQINVSSLKAGNYFLNIYNSVTNESLNFIKQ